MCSNHEGVSTSNYWAQKGERQWGQEVTIRVLKQALPKLRARRRRAPGRKIILQLDGVKEMQRRGGEAAVDTPQDGGGRPH